MVEERITFIKLNDQNYDVWKFKMEMLLTDKDLWDAVTTDRPNVEGQTRKSWDKMDRSARAKIVLCVEDNQLIHIKHETTAKGMWEVLQKVHERKHLNTKLFLQRKLFNMKYDESMNMAQYIHNIMEIVDQLRGIGKTVPDDDVIALLLCSLPESFDALITGLEGRPESELTLEYVKGKLVTTYERRNEMNKVSEAEAAMKITAKRITDKSEKSKRICYHCGKEGHIKRNCHAWKKEYNKVKAENAKKTIDI